MSYRNRTLSEKKRIYKKLGLVITAILVVCIAPVSYTHLTLPTTERV